MKQYVYGGNSGNYKANLHSHSTLSDGKLTPEEMKDFYKTHGYSVLSLTDHNMLICHKELDDPDFLMLTGYEVDMTESKHKDFALNKTVHLNAYPPVQTEERQVLFDDSNLGYMKRLHPETDYGFIKYYGEKYKRTYCIEDINKFIDECKEHGYLVTVNHPVWSLNDPEEFADVSENLFGIEVVNGSCVTMGYGDHTTVYWDYLLRRGKRVFCTATDDNHNGRPYGDGGCDSFGGFDVINAPSLEYGNIIKALSEGNFYASDGAFLDEVYIEDGKLTVKAPGAKKISIVTGRRRCASVNEALLGRPLTEATFSVSPDDIYVRAEVEDEHGKHAYSQAYFFEK